MEEDDASTACCGESRDNEFMSEEGRGTSLADSPAIVSPCRLRDGGVERWIESDTLQRLCETRDKTLAFLLPSAKDSAVEKSPVFLPPFV